MSKGRQSFVSSIGTQADAKRDMAGNSEGTARKPPGRPFQKGQSGNPNGRPKVAEEFRELCRQATPEVFRAWLEEVRNQGENWAKCSELIAAYAVGKPTQAVEHSGQGGSPISVTFVRKGAK